MRSSPSDQRPELSVIVPTYNRGPILTLCLEAMDRQTLSKDAFEIIVADDGSLEEIGVNVHTISKRTGVRTVYFRQSNAGANAARNKAIARAGGKVLLFINDDTIPAPRLLEEHLAVHARYPDENVSVLGRVTISPEVPHSLFARLHLDAGYAQWEGKTELDWRAFYTCNVSVKRDFLLKYGLFEETIRYHEDTELAERLSHHGLRVIYHPAALGHHHHFLREEEYLRVAALEGKALTVWHRKSPQLKNELAQMGFYPTMGLRAKVRYLAANLLVNRATIPPLLALARSFAVKNEQFALLLYRKVFQALKRRAIRQNMKVRS